MDNLSVNKGEIIEKLLTEYADFLEGSVLAVADLSSIAVSTSTPRRRSWSVMAWGT